MGSPPQDKDEIVRQARLGEKEAYQLVFGCLCPACNLEKARARAVALAAAEQPKPAPVS